MLLTVVELAVVVGDALGQVEVTLLVVALLVAERGTEDGDGTVALDGEVDVLSGAGEVLAVPVEVALKVISDSLKIHLQGKLPLSLPMCWLRSISESSHSPSPRWRRARSMWPSSTRMS
jgi:hypothetical protein